MNPTDCLPSWYLCLYFRSEPKAFVSYIACFLAAMRFFVKLCLWPVDLTWATLMRADTMLYEIMALGTEIIFLCWIWMGEARPHPHLMSLAPAWIPVSPVWFWTLFSLSLIIDHVYCIRSRDRDLRAMALMFDVFGYVWLTAVVLRSRFYFEEVFIWVFALGGVIAVLALRSSRGGHGYGRD